MGLHTTMLFSLRKATFCLQILSNSSCCLGSYRVSRSFEMHCIGPTHAHLPCSLRTADASCGSVTMDMLLRVHASQISVGSPIPDTHASSEPRCSSGSVFTWCWLHTRLSMPLQKLTRLLAYAQKALGYRSASQSHVAKPGSGKQMTSRAKGQLTRDSACAVRQASGCKVLVPLRISHRACEPDMP
jgi:hypothetical protein